MIKQLTQLIVMDIYWIFVKLFGSANQKRNLARLRALFETDLVFLEKVQENFMNTVYECAIAVAKKLKEKFLEGGDKGELSFPSYVEMFREKYLKYLIDLYGGGIKGIEKAQKALEEELAKLKMWEKVYVVNFLKRDTNNKR